MAEATFSEAHFFGVIKPILTVDIILFLICLGGMSLNIILFYLAILRKGPKAIDMVLILIISFFDSLVCLTIIVSLIYRWWYGSEVLVGTSLWCTLNAIFLNASVLTTFLGAAILSLARYLALVRKWELSNKFWIIVSISLVGLIWFTHAYRSIYEEVVVLPSGLYCIPIIYGNDLETKLFGYMILTILYPTSIIIPVCYTLIIRHIRPQFSGKFNPFHHRGTLHLTLTVISYILCIFPDYIHILLSALIQIPRTSLSDGVVMTLTFSLTIINALFSLFMHDQINDGFRSLFSFSKSNQRFISNT